MYLNHGRIAASRIVNIFVIIGCGILSFINLLFMSAPFSTSSPVRGTGGLIFAGFFFMLLAGCVGIMIWRIIALRRVSRCRIYNSLLEEDHDGILTYDSIASMTGSSVPRIVRDLMWFTGHGFMINITLGREAVRVDLLSDEKEFIAVSCPSCGAVVNIRKGGGGRCQHCGTFMRLAEDQNVQK